MNVYVDTSAALKLWIDEPQAEAVRLALEDARQVASSVLIRVEAASTLARLLRERRVSAAHVGVVQAEVDFHLTVIRVLELNEHVIELAAQLCAKHQLKSLDALHLATALILRVLDPVPWVFMTFDLKLGRAASAEGLTVWPVVAPPPPGLREDRLSVWAAAPR